MMEIYLALFAIIGAAIALSRPRPRTFVNDWGKAGTVETPDEITVRLAGGLAPKYKPNPMPAITPADPVQWAKEWDEQTEWQAGALAREVAQWSMPYTPPTQADRLASNERARQRWESTEWDCKPRDYQRVPEGKQPHAPEYRR